MSAHWREQIAFWIVCFVVGVLAPDPTTAAIACALLYVALAFAGATPQQRQDARAVSVPTPGDTK